jgi:hypothetical protein
MATLVREPPRPVPGGGRGRREEPTGAVTPRARGSGLSRLYALYAAGFLVLTLLSGVWLRAAFVVPGVLGGWRFGDALHAHSHVAFFGWTTMALYAALLRRLPARVLDLRWHAHLTAAASAAAFAGFLAGGYNAWTIGISVVHVVLWITFAALAGPAIASTRGPERPFLLAAVASLVVAGAGAMAPGVVMARGIEDPWIGQAAIHAFLTPFTAGWLVLGMMGVVYAGLAAPRHHRLALWATIAGIAPSVLLHPSAPPPAEWYLVVGRIGTALVGIGSLAFAADVLRERSAPLIRLAAVAIALKGASEVTVASGIGLEWIYIRPLGIAYLHLLLLGAVTPALMSEGLGARNGPRRSIAYAGGLGVMLAALVAVGLPALAPPLAAVGITAGVLYWAALAGGAVCAAAGTMLVAPGRSARAAARGESGEGASAGSGPARGTAARSVAV